MINFHGTDGPNFGPIPIESLEEMILTGDVGAVIALDALSLERVVGETRQQAVAAIILDIGDKELLGKLMRKYIHGHGQDKWLKRCREDHMRDLIKRLKKAAKF